MNSRRVRETDDERDGVIIAMYERAGAGNIFRNFYQLTALITASFTLIVSASLAWNLRHEHLEQIALARKEALATFNKDLSFRSWATKHGGVYVPATAETPPNPNLSHIPERDIVTPSGRRLTLMNPAYIMKQTMAEYNELYGVKGHITSLNAINPANAPDAWERSALEAFARGATEVAEITEIDGKPHLRLIKPMITQEGCLKCHGHQGYKVGDVRGGIEISVPMSPYIAEEKGARNAQAGIHLLIWLLGMTGIGFGVFKNKGDIIARAAAEESLRKSEENFRLILNSAGEGIYGIDLRGNCTFANPACAHLLGYRHPDEFIGKNLHRLIHHSRKDGTPYPEEECLNYLSLRTGEGIHSDDEYFWRADGSCIPVEYRSYPQQVDGVSVGGVVTFVDITLRRRAEEAAATQRRQLEAFFENTLMCIAILDRDFNFIRVNEAYARADGRNPADFIGHNHFEFYPSELKATFEQVAVAGKPCETIARPFTYAEHPERGVTYWDWTLMPVLDARGETEELILTLTNVTERHRAEEEVLKLSNAIEQSPVSIVITNAQGNIEFVNPRFTQVTGYLPEEALGQNPRILKSGETPLGVYGKLWATIKAGNVWQGEFRNRKKNGELFWEYATISPVKNQQGVITHYIAIKEDFTERRNLESQLRHSQKMEAVGTLTGGIAHDFNNILTAIIGFGSLMEMKMAEDDPLRVSVTQILAAADRAANLTRSLLAFSRKQPIDVKPASLNEIVSGLEKMLRRFIPEDIDLQIRLTEEVLTVMADAGQIAQVLINLTTNARDSMASGGSIIITTEQIEIGETFRSAHGYGEPGSYALITFSDSGKGMEESVRKRIFEPFFTTKEVGKGTGLGLSVCYGIIKQHGGFINCYSEPGKGTAFRIYLPLVRGEAEHEEPAEETPIAGGTETILLAEDDPSVRELTTKILKEYGYSVIEAKNGEEAVAIFSGQPDEIQLCLFDLIMPKKNGRDACEEIMKLRPGFKVLFMSGYQADISIKGELLQKGADLISKPVLPRELLKRVREALDRGPQEPLQDRPEQ